jgi:hypothetical protein
MYPPFAPLSFVSRVLAAGLKADAIALTAAAAMSVPALAMRTTEKKRFRLNQRRVFICFEATDNELKLGQIWGLPRLQQSRRRCQAFGRFFLAVTERKIDNTAIAYTKAGVGRAGSAHLPCSRIKSCNRFTASASGILNLTAVLPT